MIRKLIMGFVLVSSFFMFLNLPDCAPGSLYIVMHPSFDSQGTNLYVMLRTAENSSPSIECYFKYDRKPDTAMVRCGVKNASGSGFTYIDTTVIFVDTTKIIIDGKRGMCDHIDVFYKSYHGGLNLNRNIIKSTYIPVYMTTNDTYNLSGYLEYYDPGQGECHLHYKTYDVEFSFILRSDFPYVWIKPLGHDPVFVSPETSAYMIDETFPLVEQDSFRLSKRRVFKFRYNKFYHYGSVELVPRVDSGWARVKVSFSVVPRLGWTLPPERY